MWAGVAEAVMGWNKDDDSGSDSDLRGRKYRNMTKSWDAFRCAYRANILFTFGELEALMVKPLARVLFWGVPIAMGNQYHIEVETQRAYFVPLSRDACLILSLFTAISAITSPLPLEVPKHH